MRIKTIIIFIFIILFSIVGILSLTVYPQGNLTISIYANKTAFIQREIVNIYGNLTYNGQPASDGLVALQIQNPQNKAIMYRAILTGSDSLLEEPVSIIEVLPCNEYLNPKYSFKIEDIAYFKVTMKNNGVTTRRVRVTISILDGTKIALDAKDFTVTIPGGVTSYAVLSIIIPPYAYIGKATAIASIFSDLPANGGVPYSKEKSIYFEITRSIGITTPPPPVTVETSLPGTYNVTFKLSPMTMPGTYQVYVNAKKEYSIQRNSTNFNVQSIPNPPQASFTYTPLKPYVNQTVTFDASASSAENWNDTIIRYEWDFGDNTPKVVMEGTWGNPPSPIVTHVYTQPGRYIITLNVTDTDGLWSTTSKPIDILPPSGPTASFTWFPTQPYVNQTVTFDASTSLPGWNGTQPTPIVSYRWNFGDGNTTTTSSPIINHAYKLEGNYTVTLTVTDSRGLTDNMSQIIRVKTRPLLIGDLNGDGIVDYADISIVCRAYGSYPGHPRWDERADINGDEFVDYADIGICARNYGKSGTY
ncbi:MAG: PKD domain-containing protein [Candidatus Bathyarchaeia archaeon]